MQKFLLGIFVGSCIANLLLILGIAAVIKPVKINKCVMNEESILVLLSSIILLLFAAIGLLDEYHLIGGGLFILFLLDRYVFSSDAQNSRSRTLKQFVWRNPEEIFSSSSLVLLGLS